jgi:uncharacterized membrane protein YfcA
MRTSWDGGKGIQEIPALKYRLFYAKQTRYKKKFGKNSSKCHRSTEKRNFKILLFIAIIIPLSLFIGVSASAIGATAWPLVVPVLFVFFGFDLYATLLTSLILDIGNALIMSAIAGYHRQIDYRRGLRLTAYAFVWIAAGVFLGTKLIPQNQELFRGSAGYVNLVLGALFIRRGFKARPRPTVAGLEALPSTPGRMRQGFLYAGIAMMAFHVGLFGIGGGMGFAVFLMACLSFPILKATGTAMFMTVFSALFAAIAFFFQLPEGVFVQSNMHWIALLMMSLSAVGAIAGARVTYSLPIHRINFLVGGIIFTAGLLATFQSWILSAFTAS